MLWSKYVNEEMQGSLDSVDSHTQTHALPQEDTFEFN